MSEFTEYRVTFGQQYHHERHPRFPAAHPDGWLTVFAREEITARVAVIDCIGRGWSSVYEPADDWYPTTEHYPRGELGRMVARLVVTGPVTDTEVDDARRAGPHALGCPALDEDPDGIEQCQCEPAQVTR